VVTRNGGGPEELESFDPAQVVREELQRRSGPWRFQTFFEDTIWQYEPPNRLSVSTPDRERRIYIEKAYGDRIRDAARAVLKSEIELTIDEIQVARPSRTDSNSPGRPGSLPTELTFETFVMGSQSRVAHAVALSITEKPGDAYNPVFICGPPGVGKTHLLQAICCRLREKASLEPLLLGSQEFVDRFTAAASRKNLDDFRERIREAHLLAIDDLQFLWGMESTREELFRTIDSFVRRRRQVVLSSTVPSGDAGDAAARMRSRFPSRLVAYLAPPEIETRIEILRRLAARRNCDLPLDVAQLIASRTEENVRELEGCLAQVLHTAASLNLPVDLVTAQLSLDPLPMTPGVRRSPSVASITFTVAEHFLVKEKDVTGPSQKRRVVLPRQIAMYLCRELTHRSLMDIGSQFGRRDHTTVIHAVRRVEDLKQKDHRVQRDLMVLKARILSRA